LYITFVHLIPPFLFALDVISLPPPSTPIPPLQPHPHNVNVGVVNMAVRRESNARRKRLETMPEGNGP